MFLKFKHAVESALKSALDTTGYSIDDLFLEESTHSDLASSLSFRLAPEYRQNPAIIAGTIADAIAIPENSLIDRVEVAGAYINFFVSKKFLNDTIHEIFEKRDSYGAGHGKGRVIIEHTSANPNGPLHVGHIRNSIIGDTLARILKKVGYDVDIQYYTNDMGRQIAIVAWALDRFEFDHQKKTDHAIADVYIHANQELNEDLDLSQQIDEMMQKIELGDERMIERFDRATDLAISGIASTLERMNIHHDRFVYESKFVKDGEVAAFLQELEGNGLAEIIDGALTVPMPEFDKDLVIRRSNHTSLYVTRDLAYHRWKAEQCDRMIDVLGADHKLISSQLCYVLRICGIKEPEIVIFEFVSLPEGSMSTRAGKFISADDLLDQVEKQALAEVTKRRPDTTEEFRRRVSVPVGIGAVRYDIVKISPEKATTFDWKSALDFDKLGAPFIQYSHARARSILRKASGIPDSIDPSVLTGDAEISLVKQLARFSHVVDAAASDLKPHIVAIYARELAEAFNQFYRLSPVLSAPDGLRDARIGLVECARIVLAGALDVLGIDAPESM
ncbi:MAG TPA: arginine--tRNA ligase [Methanosarcinales archaeon]|nr:arginine--tRNA ligase [Methanosarcinales archaeon]